MLRSDSEGLFVQSPVRGALTKCTFRTSPALPRARGPGAGSAGTGLLATGTEMQRSGGKCF